MNQKFLFSEKFFIILIAAIAIAFNLLPYIYERQIDNADKTYIGAFPVLIDKPAYLAEMTQGEEGEWKTINKFTSEPQKPAFIYTFYIFLGHIARLLDISVETTFLLSRFAFGIILMAAIVYFIRQFIENETQRKIAYLFAFFSSGLNWLIPAAQRSVDPWTIDAMPIIRFSHFPHITFANALLLIIFLLIYKSFASKKTAPAIAAGVIAFFLNLILPYHGILAYTVILLFSTALLIKNKITNFEHLRYAIVFFLISSPSFFYLLYLTKLNFIWANINKAAILPPSSLSGLFFSFGLILIFAFIGIYEMNKRKNNCSLFFSLWIFAAFFLAYSPLIIIQQRRFLETGFYVPLSVAASFGIMGIYQYLKNIRAKTSRLNFIIFPAIIVILFLLIGNIKNWLEFKALLDFRDEERIYIDTLNIEAMRWLRQNSLPDSIILSSFADGNLIPYYANRAVYIGHGPMTIDLEDKLKKVEDFYSEKYSPGEMLEFLKKENINYVFYSDEEKKLGNLNPENYDFLKEAYPPVQNAANINSCPNNDISANSTSSQPANCMGAEVYQNETVKIYKFIDKIINIQPVRD